MSWSQLTQWWYGPEPEVVEVIAPVVRVDMATGSVEGPPPVNDELRAKIALRRQRIEGRQGTVLDRVIFRDYWQSRGASEVDIIRDFVKRENCHREMRKAD